MNEPDHLGDLSRRASEQAPASGGQGLARDLKSRHVQLIGLGGAIGVGLFLGSGRAIRDVGPALIVNYAIAGLVISIVLRALGEMLLYRPVTGSFATYAEDFVGAWAGFVTGWSYWLNWVLVGMAQITAIAIYVRFWFPGVPQWLPALLALAAICAMNMRPVRKFGELEFWLALVKVTAILALISTGVVAMLLGLGSRDAVARLSNLWSYGGLFPRGYESLFGGLTLATFAFGGVEMIGVAAGETSEPAVAIPKAIRGVSWSIVFFYIGSLIVVMSIIPWTAASPSVSPFVTVFKSIGIPVAAGLMNLVVISAAGSSCSSGIFGSARMLHVLGRNGHAPRVFSRLGRSGVPTSAVAVSIAVMSVGVLLNYLIASRVFYYVIDVVLITQLWTWASIAYSHIRFRKAVDAGLVSSPGYRLPFSPYTEWLALGYMAVVAIHLAVEPATRFTLPIAMAWFGALGVGFVAMRRTRAERDRRMPRRGGLGSALEGSVGTSDPLNPDGARSDLCGIREGGTASRPQSGQST